MNPARRAALAAFAALALAAPASAKEEGKSADSAVKLATVALPVILNGRVVNYVFLDIRLDIRPGADSDRVRDREPYFRDLLVRVGHSRPFSRPGDPVRLDEGRIRATLMAAAPGLVGPGLVAGAVVVKQTPQHPGVAFRAVPAPHAIIP